MVYGRASKFDRQSMGGKKRDLSTLHASHQTCKRRKKTGYLSVLTLGYMDGGIRGYGTRLETASSYDVCDKMGLGKIKKSRSSQVAAEGERKGFFGNDRSVHTQDIRIPGPANFQELTMDKAIFLSGPADCASQRSAVCPRTAAARHSTRSRPGFFCRTQPSSPTGRSQTFRPLGCGAAAKKGVEGAVRSTWWAARTNYAVVQPAMMMVESICHTVHVAFNKISWPRRVGFLFQQPETSRVVLGHTSIVVGRDHLRRTRCTLAATRTAPIGCDDSSSPTLRFGSGTGAERKSRSCKHPKKPRLSPVCGVVAVVPSLRLNRWRLFIPAPAAVPQQQTGDHPCSICHAVFCDCLAGMLQLLGSFVGPWSLSQWDDDSILAYF